jgi:hypothetical protein
MRVIEVMRDERCKQEEVPLPLVWEDQVISDKPNHPIGGYS